jgi:hypothetical protein
MCSFDQGKAQIVFALDNQSFFIELYVGDAIGWLMALISKKVRML